MCNIRIPNLPTPIALPLTWNSSMVQHQDPQPVPSVAIAAQERRIGSIKALQQPCQYIMGSLATTLMTLQSRSS